MSRADQEEQVRQSADRLELPERTATHFPTQAELQAMMSSTATEAVRGTLTMLGIDCDNPLSAQQDFAKLRALRKLMEAEDFLSDLAFVRRLRLNSERITNTSVTTFVRWAVVGLLGLVVLLTKDWWITHFKG